MVKSRKWVIAKAFDGFPKSSDFKMVEETLPPLNNKEILIDAEFISVDPYMRLFPLSEGVMIPAIQLGRVLESKNTEYTAGSYVVATAGWRDKSIINPSDLDLFGVKCCTKMADIGDLPKSLCVGSLGMPGIAAYFGFLRICKPKEGDVVLVNAAAGAVGNIVGQIAKIYKCKVIGYAGSDDKVDWLKSIGFDYAFNYKTCDLDKTLKKAAPDGIDCYFDNVGGDFTYKVIANHMKNYGRISICGSIDAYNDKTDEPKKGPHAWRYFVTKQLNVEGFLFLRWESEFNEALSTLQKWVKEGKLKYKEHFTEGFKNIPDAFMDMLKGGNIGKAVVKI